ncbi:flavodoxin-dependent (E)-4-hydroxy-3-methylbut-2-enyl-diphosphate synthase [Shouchella clausii]|jgi:(E)-4-hydroxy-3-methylbut-2-enyl-diphosphate synthase|uniref:flavodoxin-dependent (E)-4-hydroxy-3-methylbut-2-enyl-diphosphate synthase n=1 Tax=Shouchella clausii TaxID=79880 RepID=UPI000BA60576|nr:flavodoxin-dependent (E)-4-hydroxy-3-methylbut-2-enyl-diphosphate synthase [Shouchella clausii]PAD43574.1 4-hydroxy-3-methylbut-2-en-1-yl diphosphate synthase [Bacillus sp. 7520-S]MBU8595392.1 flavodoxin-dependent (E)-4-hydroxy-3-methylbut-2-enyl-diphosphate synthase [Shouchella clausii]MED4160993.1 flavodoxin-dependent (E)-4-hydroxy-3-methylbut-2-enyl-diphosphate synthase [Shouchella clausii]MED4178909.1 flavodoxin-dependent (E)-4-hydroxy-3-methylbut-2-enyl-diphosphate synthase [Shouchella 
MAERVHRKNTRPVKVGNLTIGGNDEIIIQSMTTTKTHDVEATVAEINRLEEAGCQIVRVACPDMRAAEAISEIKKRINIPLVVDIHFNYKFALKAIEGGADKIRINPGNIGKRENVEAVVKAAKEKGIPIRIGVNAGSLERHLLEKYGYPTADAMVESALHHIRILEELDFYDIIVSMKASDVRLAIEAYDKASKAFDYPLHLGITESGTLFAGTVKSAAGIGALLHMGIGNTLRISLSADPVEEVKVARELLKSFGLAANAATLISCPTCGRIEIDLISIANEVEEYIAKIKAPIKVAVLGCAVNGPGEAREADIGIAGARGEGLLFMKGEIVRKVPEETMVEELKKEIDKLAEEHYAKQREAQPN